MNTKKETEYQALLAQHRAVIYAVCWRYSRGNSELTKELFEEVARALWVEYSRYRKLRFSRNCSESTWVYRLAQNSIVYYLRQYEHREEATLLLAQSDLEEMPIVCETPDPVLSREDNYSYTLMQLIQHLNSVDQRLILYYLEGNSYAEIARLMEMSETNIGTRMSRLLKKLKELGKQV